MWVWIPDAEWRQVVDITTQLSTGMQYEPALGVSYGVRSPVPLSDVFCTLLLSTVGEFKGTFQVYVSQSMNVLLLAVAILSTLGVTGDLLRVEDTVWDMRYEI
jgi:hypothetical protein